MGIKPRISVIGVKTAIMSLTKHERQIASNMNNNVRQATFFVEGQVKKSIAGKDAEPKSVDTGRYLNSTKSTFPRKFIGRVSTNVKYAKFLENMRHHYKNTERRATPRVLKYFDNLVAKYS